MKCFCFRIWQWLWGFPQTLIGAFFWLLHRKRPHFTFNGCAVTVWKVSGSLGMGMFLFLNEEHYARDPQVLIHEFGHAVQSAFLGPLFLPVMGIPSFLWCNLPVCRRLRKEKGISYYSFYPESTANRLGAWAAAQSVTADKN